MSSTHDVEILRSAIASGESAGRVFAEKRRASSLMREAANVLLGLPSAPDVVGAAGKLAEACDLLAGPKDGDA